MLLIKLLKLLSTLYLYSALVPARRNSIIATSPMLQRYTQKIQHSNFRQMNQEMTSNLFLQLIGKQLSSVEFVQDYLQLRFDGPCINVYNPLTVSKGSLGKTSWENGFRDLLCEQITKIVKGFSYEDDSKLTIQFDDDSEVIISLRQDDYSSLEAFYAHGFDDKQWLAV